MGQHYDEKEAELMRQALLRAWFALVPGAGASGDEKAEAGQVAEYWGHDCRVVIQDGGLMLGSGHLNLKLPELVQAWIEKTLASGA